ncbi:MAG: ABC transporter ATP-binding protein [Sarcina sp.]
MKINTNNLKININKTEIVKGISLDVTDKEFVGIIGPNGSGKTTFLKSLYRVLSPSSGCIYFDGKSIKELKLKETAKKIGVVGQHNFYNFDFTVFQMVLMGRSPHKKLMESDNANDYKIATNALEKVDLLDFAERSYATLSGGEQQRVILARALTQEAKALILDEPTNHLDIKYKLQLLSLVKSLNIEVISAIHDLNLAAMYCDKIYVINKGLVHAFGTPKEVLTPELLKEVFEVDAKISWEGNIPNIIYKNTLI